MKPCLIVLMPLLIQCYAFSQTSQKTYNKAPIDFSTFGKWPFVSSVSISNDGNYVQYSIYEPSNGNSSIKIHTIKDNSSTVIPSPCQFTDDSRFAIFSIGDSLEILKLQDKSIEIISSVVSFTISSKGNWLAYLIKSSNKLIVRSLDGQGQISFDSVSNYIFNIDGIHMLLESANHRSLLITNLLTKETNRIWNGLEDEKPGSYIFSTSGYHLAFVVERKNEKQIWYYKATTEGAVLTLKDNAPGIDSNLFIEGIDYRGLTDGGKIFIKLKEKDKPVSSAKLVSVDIWSYADKKLQPQQLKKLKPQEYVAVLKADEKSIFRLEKGDEKVIANNDNYAVIADQPGDLSYDEWYWNRQVQSSVYLVSLNDGSRKLINNNLPAAIASSYLLSPEGNYIIYYDAEKKNYFSYEIKSCIHRNITKGANAKWTRYDKKDIWMGKYLPVYSGSAGWIKGDKAILLYDQNDIFKADPAGKVPVVNLTNGYGKRNNIELRLAIETNNLYTADETIILSAFNRTNKNDGFYKMNLNEKRDPVLLTMQPYVFKGTWEDERFIPVYPTKARDTGIYLVRRMSAHESPNYFWTTDFRNFNAITAVYPEKNFNWMTTELITWKTLDGSTSQGILYKPQNFNPQKKYPIIFHYYERVSEALNVFINPEVSNGELNIPYFVSNGYLVFTPDIHYTIGHPGTSVINSVISAANFLSRLSYVDEKHMGLQGHSRGGWETNYLITHTNVFAAAVSASGMCDYISLYNGIRTSGISRQTAFEISYQRIGATLWENPTLYIENSPIFRANNVQTPLLMMGNKQDGDVPFEQSIEFFTALRRLGKKVWMLQYDGAGHIVFGKAAEDFTTRMKQFFDYYLKGISAPKWMTLGIPASKKGVIDGLDFESPGIEPPPGLFIGKTH